MPNHLANALSPYLLEHSLNPVDWYPWGEEALTKARSEGKPIFLSIGYAACHWCHVMAHESFEDPEIAAILNEHFISIKVDREERPDLDQIFMSVVVAITGQGGWPMSLFLTPSLQPFFGGTYFPPTRHGDIPGFRDLLNALAEAWRTQRAEIDRSGAEITSHLAQLDSSVSAESKFTPSLLEAAAQELVRSYDWEYGGWGGAPKFPHPMALEFLIRRALEGDDTALKPVVHALHAMARGGMYDVVGGGFARYSTDPFWRVPHFEKMLYDNAQLAQVYLHAWQVTHDDFFQAVLTGTLDFISREMTSPEGGFYSSLDADSDGEEGKFYVWDPDEIRKSLGDKADFFIAAYGITPFGNWEGKTVLQRAMDDASLASQFKLTRDQISIQLAECHSRLLAVRSSRPRPKTDDKILAGWNGLMLAAVAQAARYFPNTSYQEMATRNAEFILSTLTKDHRLRHAWRNGKLGREVYLEDYASMILGLLELYQTDFNPRWFQAGCELADQMIANFEDPHGGFYDTEQNAERVLVRPKDHQDNATPSGNALAISALLKLSAFTENEKLRALAERSLDQVSLFASKYPASFAFWLSAADFLFGKVRQVAILGNPDTAQMKLLLDVVRAAYRPNTVIAYSKYPPAPDAPGLLKDRPLVAGVGTAYVCERFVCKEPVVEAKKLEEIL